MATATLWDHKYLGGSPQRVVWNYPNVTSIQLTYHAAGAVAEYIYYENGQTAVRKPSSSADNTVNLQPKDSGSEAFFSGAGKGGYVSFVVEYNSNQPSGISVGDISADQASIVTITSQTVQNPYYKVYWYNNDNLQQFVYADTSGVGPGATQITSNNMYALAQCEPAKQNMTIKVVCQTYTDSALTQYVGESTAYFTLNLFTFGTMPTFSSAPQFSLVDQFSNTNLANHTKVRIQATANSNYGVITWYSVVGKNISLSEAVASPGQTVAIDTNVVFADSGEQQVTITAYDQRGNAVSATSPVYNVNAYKPPSCAATMYRVADTTFPPAPAGDGTYVCVDINMSYQSLSSNSAYVTVWQREHNPNIENQFLQIQNIVSPNGTSAQINQDGKYILNLGTQTGFDKEKSYDIRFIITDSVSGTSEVVYLMPAANSFLRFEKSPPALGVGSFPTAASKQGAGGVVYINDNWKFYVHGSEIINLIDTEADGIARALLQHKDFVNRINQLISEYLNQ